MLANGNIAAHYGVLSGGFAGTDETVNLMRQMSQGRYGSRSAKIRALAINIVRQAGVVEKNEYAEMLAIHKYVRDQIRYQKDVHGQETLSHPEETAFNSRAGDCDDKAMLEAALLSSIGIPTRFKTIGVTPLQFSHVYLEAHPMGHDWIPLDPIMKNKPAGWEVPKNKQKLVKIYQENRPTGDGSMGRLGYVGEPDGMSHLGPATGGTQSPYVQMRSFLAHDAPIEQISQQMPANGQNASIPQQFPKGRMQAHRVDPILHRPTQRREGQLPEASMGPIESEAMNPGAGVDGVFTPDALAGYSRSPAVASVMGVGTDNGREGADVVRMPKQGQPAAYMQSKTTSHQPQGIDEQFLRPQLIHDASRKGDTIEYRGHWDLSERPRIYPVTGMSGYADDRAMLPGMGYVGAEEAAPAKTPNKTLQMVGVGLLLLGIYKIATRG